MLTRRRQLAAKIESLEGTAESITASDAKLLVENPVVDVDPAMHERNPAGSSFSKIGELAGKRISKVSFTMKLRGSGSISVEPEWFKLIKACGWQVNNLDVIEIGSITSGPFRHGETITGGTSTATGRVVIATANGTDDLYFVPVSGTFSQGETITGSASGASATTSSVPADAGKELKPISNPASVPSLTVATYEDGIKKIVKGLRGKVKIDFKVGEPVVMNYEFSGSFVSASDGAMLSNIAHESTKPPVFLNASLAVDGYEARMSELEIDWANVLSIRDDVTDETGVLSYVIADRKPVGSFNPEMVSVSAHDFFGKWFSNAEMVLDFTVGASGGNRFRFYAPKVQYSKVADEDRDGIATARTSFLLNGTVDPGDDELTILAI